MIASEKLFSTSETAYAVDRNGKIVAWNQAAEHAFGYTRSKALGQNCWELLSGRDIFGNQSCCEGCPIRSAAFDNEPINRFQIDFETAAHERKRFTVSTLILFNGSGQKVFVHLCHPEPEATENNLTRHANNPSTVKTKLRALTPRETEVLSLLHQGMTVAQVAAAMRISPSTVRNHTQHILFKLHVHSRFEAVALGRKLGLI